MDAYAATSMASCAKSNKRSCWSRGTTAEPLLLKSLVPQKEPGFFFSSSLELHKTMTPDECSEIIQGDATEPLPKTSMTMTTSGHHHQFYYSTTLSEEASSEALE